MARRAIKFHTVRAALDGDPLSRWSVYVLEHLRQAYDSSGPRRRPVRPVHSWEMGPEWNTTNPLNAVPSDPPAQPPLKREGT